MAKNYPDYDDLVQMFQDGSISAVDFVTQQSDDITEEYETFCRERGLDKNSTASAESFIDYRAQLLEESIAN